MTSRRVSRASKQQDTQEYLNKQIAKAKKLKNGEAVELLSSPGVVNVRGRKSTAVKSKTLELSTSSDNMNTAPLSIATTKKKDPSSKPALVKKRKPKDSEQSEWSTDSATDDDAPSSSNSSISSEEDLSATSSSDDDDCDDNDKQPPPLCSAKKASSTTPPKKAASKAADIAVAAYPKPESAPVIIKPLPAPTKAPSIKAIPPPLKRVPLPPPVATTIPTTINPNTTMLFPGVGVINLRRVPKGGSLKTILNESGAGMKIGQQGLSRKR
jgi:hypothetical protein